MTRPARVLVTGSTGFIGRSMVPMLEARGAIVARLGRDEAAAAPSRVVERIADFEPDVVIHLATRFIAQHDADDIPDLVRSNVELGTVVAEGACRSGARLVTIGTAWQHVDGHEYDPVSLYAATKQALSTLIDYYVGVLGLDAREATLFDTYGPGDIRPKLVPSLMRAARDGTVLSMSDGHQLVDLTYVDDVVLGIGAVAFDDDVPARTVVRSWAPLSVRDLVSTVERVIGLRVPVEWGARPVRPREMRQDWVFGSSPPGWAATVPLDDGLRRTWAAISAEGAP